MAGSSRSAGRVPARRRRDRQATADTVPQNAPYPPSHARPIRPELESPSRHSPKSLLYPYPVRVTQAAARSAYPGRAIGRRRRTPVAAGKLRLIGDCAMLHAIRKAGIGGLPAEVEIRLARMTDRPFADLVAEVEKRGLALDLLEIGRAHV